MLSDEPQRPDNAPSELDIAAACEQLGVEVPPVRIGYDEDGRSCGDFAVCDRTKLNIDLLRNALMFSDRAVGLHGAAGAGKDALAEQLAAIMGWPLLAMSWQPGPVRTITGPDGVARRVRASDETIAQLTAALEHPVVLALSEPGELAEDMAQLHLALAGALTTPAGCLVSVDGADVWVGASCVVCFCFRPLPDDPRVRLAPGQMTLLACERPGGDIDDVATMRRAETVALLLNSRLRLAQGLPAQFPDFTAAELRGPARLAVNFTAAAGRGLLLAPVSDDAACRVAQDIILQSSLGSSEPVADALRRFIHLLPEGTPDPVARLKQLAGDAAGDLETLAAFTADLGFASFDSGLGTE